MSSYNFSLPSVAAAKDPKPPRVQRACLRCRLKKRKCSGSIPCSHCLKEDAICILDARVKLRARARPEGYVDLLERAQERFTRALREAYAKLVAANAIPKPPLCDDRSTPSLNEMIEAIGVPVQPTKRSSPDVSSTCDLCRSPTIGPMQTPKLDRDLRLSTDLTSSKNSSLVASSCGALSLMSGKHESAAKHGQNSFPAIVIPSDSFNHTQSNGMEDTRLPGWEFESDFLSYANIWEKMCFDQL